MMKWFKQIDGILYIIVWTLIIVLAALILLGAMLFVSERARADSSTALYDCIKAGRPDRECRAIKRPSAREMFIEMRLKSGVTRQAAIYMWNVPRSGTKTYRCKPDKKEFTCERE